MALNIHAWGWRYFQQKDALKKAQEERERCLECATNNGICWRHHE